METFFLLVLIPVVIALIARWKFAHTFHWQEVAAQIVVISAILGGVWFAGIHSKTSDVEIWNGQIVSKDRKHGHYVTSYPCNCTTDSEGNTSCDTCYEDHYTVTWTARTTIGDIRLGHEDSTWRSVYNKPDPPQYVAAYEGEPCSIERPFTNYIKAVPESLFSAYPNSQLAAFAPLIPPYPRVHSYYKMNRVISMGVPVDTRAWNATLNEYQKVLGNQKEANIIVVLVNTGDQVYRHALEQAWLGGKQNDVIITIGSSSYPNIDWVDAITLGQNSGNSLMTVEMRDSIMSHKSLEDYQAVIASINKVVVDRFDRKPMEDFEYLKDEIDPPTWVIVLAFVLSVLLSIGATLYFHHNDPFIDGTLFSSSYRYRRYR